MLFNSMINGLPRWRQSILTVFDSFSTVNTLSGILGKGLGLDAADPFAVGTYGINHMPDTGSYKNDQKNTGPYLEIFLGENTGHIAYDADQHTDFLKND